MISPVFWPLIFPTSEGWLSTWDHWRIGALFQALKGNLVLNFFVVIFFCKVLSGDQAAV